MPIRKRNFVYALAFVVWCSFIGYSLFSVVTRSLTIQLPQDYVDLKSGWYLEVPLETSFESRSSDGAHSLHSEGAESPISSLELPIPLGTNLSEYHGIVDAQLLPGKWLIEGTAQYHFYGMGNMLLFPTCLEKLKRAFCIFFIGIAVLGFVGFHVLCYEIESRKQGIEL